MATVSIPIVRQDYRDAAQISASADAQYNGWEANTISGAITAQAITSSDTITIPADFKDHKTVFVFNNVDAAAASVTIKAGDSYQGVNDLVLSVPVGVSHIWLESAPFVDQKTGKITVTTTATEKLTVYGYEMR